MTTSSTIEQPALIEQPDCCINHDGPHIHGCWQGRVDGLPHRGQCLLKDPAGWEEGRDYTTRVQLGLRPVSYSADMEMGSHPDQRGCPSWCWTGQHENFGHEINADSPMVALHTSDEISLVASKYIGEHVAHYETVTPATWKVDLRQAGQGRPSIRVSLRQHKKGTPPVREHMALAISDAREMVTVLSYLIAMVDADEALKNSQAQQ